MLTGVVICSQCCGQMDGHDRSHAPRVDMLRVIVMTTIVRTSCRLQDVISLLASDSTAEGVGYRDVSKMPKLCSQTVDTSEAVNKPDICITREDG